MTQAEERRKVAEEELAKVNDQIAASEAALRQHREVLAGRQEGLRKLEDELKSKQDSLRQAQADAFAAAQDFTRLRNEITALDLQKQGNVVRLEKLSAEKIQLEEERTGLETRLHEIAANVQEEKLNDQAERGSVEEHQKRLVELSRLLEAAAKKQDQILEQQAETRSRLDVLEQLQADH